MPKRSPPPLPAPAEGPGRDDKTARLARARELIRRTERGWKELRVGSAGPAGADSSAGPDPPALHESWSGTASAELWVREAETAFAPKAGDAAPRPEEPFSREDHDFPLASRYGGTDLLRLRETSEEEAARLQIRPEEPGVDLSRALFLDTETSGLAGGTGTFAFLIGVGYVEEDCFG